MLYCLLIFEIWATNLNNNLDFSIFVEEVDENNRFFFKPVSPLPTFPIYFIFPISFVCEILSLISEEIKLSNFGLELKFNPLT